MPNSRRSSRRSSTTDLQAPSESPCTPQHPPLASPTAHPVRRPSSSMRGPNSPPQESKPRQTRTTRRLNSVNYKPNSPCDGAACPQAPFQTCITLAFYSPPITSFPT